MTLSLTGTLTCPTGDLDPVRAALPEHIRLTRAEPGCIAFDVTETEPGVFHVSERFVDQAAFDAHQLRTRTTHWWNVTQTSTRDFKLAEV